MVAVCPISLNVIVPVPVNVYILYPPEFVKIGEPVVDAAFA
jgi:hypothetical protein